MEENKSLESHSQEKKPELLKAILILSFIGSGLSAVVFSMYGLFFPELSRMFESGEINFPGLELLMAGGKRYFLTGAVLYCGSFSGVYFMWKGRQTGFHLYTGAQVLLLILPLLVIDGYPLPIFDGLITLAFILFYSRYLKRLQ